MNLPPNNIDEQAKGTKNNRKDAYYFPHDCTARNDPKVISLRMKYGAEGYGIYFMILELLRAETDYTIEKNYNVIAFELRLDEKKVKAIIEDFGLFIFTDERKYFYSEGLKKRMIPLDNLREQRSQAGKKSAKKRWNNNDRYSNAITTVTKNCNNKNKKNNKNNKNNEREKSSNSDTPPTINEIKNFLEGMGKWNYQTINDEAHKMHSHYTANGWRIGNNPVQNWQAVAEKWMLNKNQFNKEPKESPNPMLERMKAAERKHRQMREI